MTVYAINKRTKEHLVWDFRGPLPQPHDWHIVEADADGWIPWDGDDECPLPDDARLELKFADGDVVGYSRAENVIWENYPSDAHEERIIAYRPILDAEDEPESPEWNGEGLPPVGCEVEYTAKRYEEWKPAIKPGYYYRGTIIAYNEGSVWTSDNGIRQLDNTLFRPIRSEEDRAVDEIAMLLDCGKPPRHNAIELYRAGYRKVK